MNYSLIYYGNKLLQEPAREIADIDGNIAGLIDSMYKIMYKANGIGLAAPQIGLNSRIIVIDTKEGDGSPIALINPVIKQKSDILVKYEEGCLSLPGIMFEVTRPERILVSGLNRDGKEIDIEAGGLLARVFQHEIDHLNGILFIDYIDAHIRNEFRSELKKIKKLNKANT
ncbi:MAG: peptide deformylase [Leptospirales bacterium]|nr:peptide deformylase [Leptospirales bacterium]